MRILRFALPVLMLAGLVTAVPSFATSTPTPSYYLALGDSLSQGYQPGLGNTTQGYVDDLYDTLKVNQPDLQLDKLGCSGETTGTMINGGVCTYPEGSQLKAAVAFLASHKGEVKYLTLDIGANDVDNCAVGGSINTSCVAAGLQTIGKNLVTILGAITSADGRTPLSVGMTYYDPFLASYLTGTSGKEVATLSVGLAAALNTELSVEFSLYGLHTADVSGAFQTGTFAPQVNTPPYGKLPTNVHNICTFTYMCSLSNIHANPAGYALIASVFSRYIK